MGIFVLYSPQNEFVLSQNDNEKINLFQDINRQKFLTLLGGKAENIQTQKIFEDWFNHCSSWINEIDRRKNSRETWYILGKWAKSD